MAEYTADTDVGRLGIALGFVAVSMATFAILAMVLIL